MYYRQALQLVPDIESRVSHGEEGGRTEEEEEEGRGVPEDSLPGLVPSFRALSLDAVCEPKSPSNVSPGHTMKIFGTNPCPPHTQEVHISALPAEVLRYILRWVVSAQLDMRALEQVARVSGRSQAMKSLVLRLFCCHSMQVCRGFYLLAREAHLWRMACRK